MDNWNPNEDGQSSPSFLAVNWDAPHTVILEARDVMLVGSVRLGTVTVRGHVATDLTLAIEPTEYFKECQ